MAYDTNFLFRLQPLAGDAAPTDKVDSTALATTGTVTLVDVGAEKAWNFAPASSGTKSVPAHSIVAEGAGTGITLVVRYRFNAMGGDNFDEIVKVLNNILDLEKNGNSNLTFRANGNLGGKNIPEGVGTGVVKTLVCRLTVGVSPTGENNNVWVGGLARSGDAPNYTSVTPYNYTSGTSVTTSGLTVQALGTMNIDILDLILYSGEKTNAECAQLADNLRTVLPASGGVATAYTITAEQVSDTHTAGAVTLTYAGSGTAYTLVTDSVSDTHNAGEVTLTYSALASISSEPLYNNTNGTTGLLANTALDYVAIYNNVTGALVLRVTGISTNASGIFTVSDAALTPGVTYKLDWQITTTGVARMPVKAAV